ncbi:MarR family transcriptional regulator [Geovibrio thiophilus]|uniref:MarR family transcriptional regulator n=1 Tax=Geovibrio thiophilus TaxID=139438 RepID=A0A410JWX8_9BACT|nr:MarR family transcriptional regulator [Geovibrio thiophilus]QAR32710.1 MarR family transcriptional regulator [Geovibrio thiophilus]
MEGHTPKKCLYAASMGFARQISKLAEECFSETGMNPSQAFLLMLAADEPGINPTKAAELLALAPSTITRFADGLERKGYITRSRCGKSAEIYATEKGREMTAKITEAAQKLYEMYSEKLGRSEADNLAQLISDAAEKMR